MSADDVRYMRLALAVGRRNLGLAHPNPSVGAVVVKDGRILGQGVTAPGGRPHAEPLALAQAGPAARGATLYVTLEPCSHHGRTPPCTDAIRAAGIARVVTALEDPDPRVAGSGHAILAEAGIALTTDLLRDEAARDHIGHVTRTRYGRPAVHLKLAQTRDGFAAGDPRTRLQITGRLAEGAVHLWRAHADAIMVGIGTVRADNPSLTVRLPGLARRSPQRVVLDSSLRIPPSCTLVRTARDVPTLVVTAGAAPAHARRMLASLGVELIQVEADARGRVDLRAALAALAARGLTRLCSEGGPDLADALAAADLVDSLTVLTGPVVLGTGGGLPALGPHLRQALASGRLVEAEARDYGPDRAVTFERSERCSPVS